MSAPSYDAIRAILDAAEAAGLPAPSVTVAWHNASAGVAADIIRAFPDRRWTSCAGGGSEWISSGNMTIFLPNRAVPSTERADIVLAAVAQ